MDKIKLSILASFFLLGFSSVGHAALVDISLDPGDCNTTMPGGNCWTSNNTANPSTSDIETLVGTSTTLTSLYKQNVGEGSDSGTFSGSYETTFSNTPSDPEDALIALIAGQDPITCGECYLIVKDGNQVPALYVFDLSLAGMINSITLTGFWPDQGAISHIEIMGDISAIPVPAAVWLFGTALIGFIGMSRRTKV